MTPGLVSIILPSLNAREFLEPRVQSILQQSYTQWEAIVLDSHSTDGTWEYFSKVAAEDSRFQLHRVAREGLYAALNHGIDLARGEYVHIATCDDTMHDDFLLETVSSLIAFPEAGISATNLQFIDQNGSDLEDICRFGDGRVRTSGFREPATAINLRPVPHDCLLHASLSTVYFSLTQLVIRSQLLLNRHHFPTDVGSIADFIWSLRLTSEAATVHIPKKLATWRFHGNQLSIQEDPTRLTHMLSACVETIDKVESLSKNDKTAILLPAFRICSHRWKPLATLGFGSRMLAYFLTSMLTRTSHWLRGVKLAGFGSGYWSTAWVVFIIGMLRVDPKLASVDKVKDSTNSFSKVSLH